MYTLALQRSPNLPEGLNIYDVNGGKFWLMEGLKVEYPCTYEVALRVERRCKTWAWNTYIYTLVSLST